ncbi:hypothetical protein C8Q79DRAFT_954052 [Trametes meyenii]|nr:hypothetical protein C8Q79DRAFT_954052 [Trametes meyenii]
MLSHVYGLNNLWSTQTFSECIISRSQPSIRSCIRAALRLGVRYMLFKMRLEKAASYPINCVVNPIVALLRSSRVELLHLALSNCIKFEEPDDLLHPQSNQHVESIIVTVRAMDLDAVAHVIAESCDSVRTITITTIMEGLSVWVVERGSGEEFRMDKVKPSYRTMPPRPLVA